MWGSAPCCFWGMAWPRGVVPLIGALWNKLIRIIIIICCIQTSAKFLTHLNCRITDSQAGSKVVFELVLHNQHFTFVIQQNR